MRVMRQILPNTKRILWLCLGFLSLGLGIIGAVLPILPTTPFVILAAFAFGRASPRLQAWLENDKTFGPIILDWRKNGAIAPRYKATALFMMICVLGLSLAMSFSAIVLVIQTICIIAAATFILSRPNGSS